MGKRSTFERVPRDFYPTPLEAVLPLIPYLAPRRQFIEPCAGDGQLVRHLRQFGFPCVGAYDIEPRANDICTGDAKHFTIAPTTYPAAIFITNPPWARSELHPIIDNLSALRPTWLLFDADWMHTRQAAPFMRRCIRVISVGRVKWIEDSPFTGKDNCAWYQFDANHDESTQFIGRAA